MTPEAFLSELDGSIQHALAAIAEAASSATPVPDLGVPALLTTALKKEFEAAEEAAMWLTGEADVEVKLALMRQCGDEAKHYRLIEARLREIGVDMAKIAVLGEGYSPMFTYLQGLETTVERLAAGPFAREALAQVLNGIFIEFCESQGDADTARLYRDVIQPDEAHHHALGRKLLARFATTEDAQDRARRAAEKTLAIAEELQEMMRIKKGISRAPGC